MMYIEGRLDVYSSMRLLLKTWLSSAFELDRASD